MTLHRKKPTRHRPGMIKPQKTHVGNQVFDSSFESRVFKELTDLLQAGVYKEVIVKPGSIEWPCGLKWKIDFKVIQDDKTEFFVEAKGLLTSLFRTQLRSYKKCPNVEMLPLVVVYANGKGFKAVRINCDSSKIYLPVSFK